MVSRLMDRAVLKGEVRAQDAISVLSGVIQNPIGTSLAWQFVRNNWDVIFKRFGCYLSQSTGIPLDMGTHS